MPRTSRADLYERELYLLRYLHECTSDTLGYATMSSSVMARETGISLHRLGYSLNALIEQGCVTKHARFFENGAQAENGFKLTPLGRRRLQEIERAEALQAMRARALRPLR